MEFKEIRREGRELALKLLYREEVTGLTDHAVPDLETADPKSLEFAELLVGGVRDDSDNIDAAISAASEHWEISRMGAVDRSIIRIGVFELIHRPETAVGPIINEAIDIARKYSGDECGRFVNGVLDRIARDVRGDPDPSGERNALRRPK
ncbi:MAG: transcription antitermination factor NusB [Candidatus Eisenbacteria bacterium]